MHLIILRGRRLIFKFLYKQIKLNSLNDIIYDSENDRYMCKEIDLSFAWESIKPPIMVIKKTKYYRTDSCVDCPHRDNRYKGKDDFRKIQVPLLGSNQIASER